MVNSKHDELTASQPPPNPICDPGNQSDRIQDQMAAAVLKATIPALLAFFALSSVATWLGGAGHELRYIPTTIVLLSLLVGWGLLRTGRIALAARAYIATLCVAVLSGMILNGGVHAPAFFALLPLLATVGWFYGGRTAVTFMVVSVVTGGAFVWLGAQGWLREPSAPTLTMIWIWNIGYLLIMLAATAIPSRMLRKALLDSEASRLESERALCALADRERSRQESERKIRAIFDLAFEFIGLLKPDGTLVEVNRTALDFAGVQPSDVLGKPFWETPWWSHSTDLQERLRVAVRKAAAGTAVQFEATHPAANGAIHIFDFSLKPVRDEAGRVVLLLPEGRDITESKVAEEALRQSDARHIATLSSMNDIVFEIDLNGCFVSYYAPISKRLYVEPDYFLGKIFDEVLPEDVCVLLRQAIESINFGNLYQQFEYHLAIDNTIQWEHAVVTPRYDTSNEIIGITAVCRDITERKAAEEARRNIEAKYREIVENAPMGIFRRDLEGKFQYVNPGLIRQLECKTEKELLDNYGLISQRWVCPERSDEFNALLLENRSIYGYETETQLVDGTTKWFTLYAFLDDSNQFIDGFSLDITERKLAEEALRHSERKARAILDQSIQFIGLVSPDGTLLDANRAALELVGVTPQDVYNKPFWESPWWNHSTELQNKLRESIKSAAAGEDIRFEASHPTIDGSLHYVDFSLRPVKNEQGDILYLIPEGHDITERKRAEEHLKVSQRKLSTLVGNLPGLAYSCKNDPGWTMIYMSTGCFNLTGFFPHELEGNKLDTYGNLIHPDDVKMVWEKVQDAINNYTYWQIEYRIHTKEGIEKWVWEQGCGVYSNAGELVVLEGFITDITERKNAEEAIKRSLREKEALIREIYHRTKNTMQIIQGVIVLQAAELSDNPEIDLLVKNTEDRIMTMSLVHQMLYQSQDLSHISINEYIYNLSTLHRNSYRISDERISFTITTDDIYFLIDTAIPLGLILNELTSNSFKYAFPDNMNGVIDIKVTLEKSGNYSLYYADNGVGVPDGFEFRDQNTLGLKLIYSIGEEQLQGKVIMENNNGVKFSLEFPGNLYKERV